MAHSPRYETQLDAAWRDLYTTVDALQAELLVAPPRARRKALAAVDRALQVKGLMRLPLVKTILADLRRIARGRR